MLWRGSVNAKSIFMQNSTAYQALFQHSNKSRLDYEKLNRKDSLSFHRSTAWSRKTGTHGFSFGCVFSGVETPYSLELLVQFVSLVSFCYMMLYIYERFQSVAGLENRYKYALASDDYSNFSDADKEKLTQEMISIGSSWM